MDEGHDIECVTERMQLFSGAQQRRVNVATSTVVFKKGYKPRRGDEFPPLFHVFSNFFILDCNSLLLTIQFSDTLTPEVQNSIHQLL